MTLPNALLRALPAFALTLAPAAHASSATEAIETCMFRHPVQAIASAAALPPAVRTALGLIAEKGQSFNTSDAIVLGRPSSRFISAGQSGDLYFVWFEQGEFFNSRRAAFLRLTPGASKAEIITTQFRTGTDGCRAFDVLLDGKPLPP
jgi:hypothetical protein